MRYLLILILILCGYNDAPPATPSPQVARFGQTKISDPTGTSFFSPFSQHICLNIGQGSRLNPACELNNSHVDLHKCYLVHVYLGIMDIKKQHIVLNLIRSGRYTSDQAGNVISHIGKNPRIIKPIEHYSGYLMYNLDIGFGEIVSVYGQGFSYLSKWLTTYNPAFVIDHIDRNKANNHPDNLRCITEKENNTATGNKQGSKIRRVRLPEDVKEAIKADHLAGISFVKLAVKYGTTRQTISKLCSVT